MHEITSLSMHEIQVGDRLRRSLNRDVLDRLKDSITKIGLKTPVSVKYVSDEEGFLLITGHHRLQACIELGWKDIPVREEGGSDLDARLWEIAENLHRAELTALEHGEHVAEWIRLVSEKEGFSRQVDEKIAKDGTTRGRPEGGVSAASRELGITEPQARRAIKVAGLTDEAKEEAKALDLDDNRTALLKAAQEPSAEAQKESLREHAAVKAKKTPKPQTTDARSCNATDKRVDAAMNAIKKLSGHEFAQLCEWFDEYRIDRK